MNKKGFTIVEILGSIVLIALLVVLTTPMIQKQLANSKEKLKAIQEKQIKDAGKTVADEIIMCEMTDDLKALTNNKSCTDLKNIMYNDSGLSITIEDLENNKYLEKTTNEDRLYCKDANVSIKIKTRVTFDTETIDESDKTNLVNLVKNINICDLDTNFRKMVNYKSCYELKNKVYGDGLTLSISDLKNNGIISSSASGNIKIKAIDKVDVQVDVCK